MTVEQLAEQYVKNNTDESVNSFNGEQLQKAYIAGAKENGVVWHKVADGDLPKDCEMVLVYTKEFGIDLDVWTGKEFDQSVTDVIAWCEIPTFTE